MRAGLLREHIVILTPELSYNSVGEQVTEYKLKHDTRARALLMRTQRTTENGEVWYPGRRTIEVRLYQDIADDDIVCWNGKRYRILSIEIDKQQQCQRLELDEINE